MEHISDKEMLEWLGAPAADRPSPSTDHLSQCEACQRRWTPLQQTWEALGAWTLQVPTRNITQAVLASIHQIRSIRFWEVRSLWRIAASIIIGLLLGYWAAERHPLAPLGSPANAEAATQLDVLGLESATGWSNSILWASEERP